MSGQRKTTPASEFIIRQEDNRYRVYDGQQQRCDRKTHNAARAYIAAQEFKRWRLAQQERRA